MCVCVYMYVYICTYILFLSRLFDCFKLGISGRMRRQEHDKLTIYICLETRMQSGLYSRELILKKYIFLCLFWMILIIDVVNDLPLKKKNQNN